jgi:hypothetical protein
MKKFGLTTTPFLALNGDIAEGSGAELLRPTNQLFNTIYSEMSNDITLSGQTLTTFVSDNPNQMHLAGMVKALCAENFVDTGTANAKILAQKRSFPMPVYAALNTAIFTFKNIVENTGAVTLLVSGISQPAAYPVLLNGVALSAGMLEANANYSVELNNVANTFTLIGYQGYRQTLSATSVLIGELQIFSSDRKNSTLLYAEGDRYRIKVQATGAFDSIRVVTPAGVLSPSQLQIMNIDGTTSIAVLRLGQIVDIEYNGAGFTVLNPPQQNITTAATDTAGADNSSKLPTTSWVKLGFTYFTSGENGYFKAPNWMGGWILQWGSQTFPDILSNSTVAIVFPLTFPNALHNTIVSCGSNALGFVYCWHDEASRSTSGMSVSVAEGTATGQTLGKVRYFAIGR